MSMTVIPLGLFSILGVFYNAKNVTDNYMMGAP